MKRLFLILFFFPIFSQAQQPEVAPHQWDGDQLIHQTVIDLPSLKEEFIFATLKSYLIDTYKNYEKVVQAEEKEAGLVSGRGLTTEAYSAFPSGTWDVFYNFKYEVKNEKIRITFSGYFLTTPNLGEVPLEQYTKNALSNNYLKNLRGPIKDVLPNLGATFDRMNQELTDRMAKSDDW